MAVRRASSPSSWSVVEAKSRLDEVVDESETAGPQTLNKNGSKLGVVVPVDTWAIKPIGNLADFFGSVGLQEGDLIIPPRAGSAR